MNTNYHSDPSSRGRRLPSSDSYQRKSEPDRGGSSGNRDEAKTWYPVRNASAAACPQRSNNQNISADESDSSGSMKGAPLSSFSSSEYSMTQQQSQNIGPVHQGSGSGNNAANTLAAAVAMMMQQPGVAAAAIAALQQQLVASANQGNGGNGVGDGNSAASLQQLIQQQLLQTALAQALNQNLNRCGSQGPVASSNENPANNGAMLLQQPSVGQVPHGFQVSESSPKQLPAGGLSPLEVLSQNAPSMQTPNLMALADCAAASAQCQAKASSSAPSSAARMIGSSGTQTYNDCIGVALHGDTGKRAVQENQNLSRPGTFLSSTTPSMNAPFGRLEKCATKCKAAGDNGQKSRKVFCLARKMPPDHNVESAYFEVDDSTHHGDELLCSHAGCRHSGIKFLWCDYCETPAYKRGFSKRHTHAGEVMPREVRKLEREEQEELRRTKMAKKNEILREKMSRDSEQSSSEALASDAADAAESPPASGAAAERDDMIPLQGASMSGNESSNEYTSEASGNDEGPQSSECSSDFDEQHMHKKAKVCPEGGKEKDRHCCNAAEGDESNCQEKKRAYYTVTFLDRCNNSENCANGGIILGSDTAMSSLSSASEHYTDIQVQAHRKVACNEKRKRTEYRKEESEMSSSVSSMDDEGLSSYAPDVEPSPKRANVTSSSVCQSSEAKMAPSLMPLADAAAAALKKYKEETCEGSSVTSSTRAVKLPSSENVLTLEEQPRANGTEEAEELKESADAVLKVGAFNRKAAKRDFVMAVVHHKSQSQSQCQSQSSSSDTPRAVSSTAGSGSRTGCELGRSNRNSNAAHEGSRSNCITSSPVQNSGSDSGVTCSEDSDESQRENWARMLRCRPASSDTKAISEWLIQLLKASDPGPAPVKDTGKQQMSEKSKI